MGHQVEGQSFSETSGIQTWPLGWDVYLKLCLGLKHRTPTWPARQGLSRPSMQLRLKLSKLKCTAPGPNHSDGMNIRRSARSEGLNLMHTKLSSI